MAASSYLSRIFAQSPVTGIERHMSKAYEAAEHLVPFIKAVANRNLDEVRSIYELIDDDERKADAIKKDLRLRLPKTIFMPVARADLLELINAQDNVANRAKDIAGLIVGRRLVIPESTADMFERFVQRAVDACKQADKTVGELGELFESGFRGHEVELMEGMIETLDSIESEADDIEIEIRSRLFDLEQSLPPVDVMFLYKIIDWIGELANDAQAVGHKIQLILAR